MHMKPDNMRKGIAYSAAGAVCWGLSGVCSQYLFTYYALDAGWLTAVRMLLSGVALLAFALPSGLRHMMGIFRSRTDLLWLLAFALVGLLLCQYTFLAAIQHSNSATATVLQSLNVVMMALLMAAKRRRGLRRSQVLALLFAVGGTFLVATHGNPSAMVISGAGLAFGLISALGVVTYTGAVLGTATRVWLIPANLDLMAVLLIAVIVIVGTAGGFSVFLQGVKYVGPEKATLIGCIEPATATALSALWLHTSFGAAEIAGFILIMLTVFLSAGGGGQHEIT